MSDFNNIFSVGSPVDQLDAEQQHKEPAPIDSDSFEQTSTSILKRLKPLLSVREEADKVYSNGYFQRHYPEAEKKIKRMLHNLVISAWANALNGEDTERQNTELSGDIGVSVTDSAAPIVPIRSLGITEEK